MITQYKIYYRDSYNGKNIEITLGADKVITDDMGRLVFKEGEKIVGVFKWEFVAGYHIT